MTKTNLRTTETILIGSSCSLASRRRPRSLKKANRGSGWPSNGIRLLLSRSRCPMMCSGRRCRFRIGILARLHHALVNRRRVLQISTRVLVGSLRYPDDIRNLLLAGALTDLDAARVDTLLLYQVSLRVNSTLGCQVHRMTALASAAHRCLLAIGVTDDDDLGVRVRLQTAGNVVQD